MEFDCCEMNYKSDSFDKKTLIDWNKNFQKLVDYKEQFGHCDVPFSWDQEKELANWAIIQRNIKHKLPPPLKKCWLAWALTLAKQQIHGRKILTHYNGSPKKKGMFTCPWIALNT